MSYAISPGPAVEIGLSRGKARFIEKHKKGLKWLYCEKQQALSEVVPDLNRESPDQCFLSVAAKTEFSKIWK